MTTYAKPRKTPVETAIKDANAREREQRLLDGLQPGERNAWHLVLDMERDHHEQERARQYRARLKRAAMRSVRRQILNRSRA